jgi:hypothetical protein
MSAPIERTNLECRRRCALHLERGQELGCDGKLGLRNMRATTTSTLLALDHFNATAVYVRSEPGAYRHRVRL